MDHRRIIDFKSSILLSDEDVSILLGHLQDVRQFSKRQDIAPDGREIRRVGVMIEGWSCRYKVLKDGGRQITAFLLPGDFCDAPIALLKHMDHGIAALGPAKVAFLADAVMERLLDRPTVLRALLSASLIDEGVLRAWIVNVGRRSAVSRIANLFCELYARLADVGMTANGSFSCPLTQEDVGDALGLTSVHVNRSLGLLRIGDLLKLKRGTATIIDLAALQRVGGFDPAYLHLANAGAPT